MTILFRGAILASLIAAGAVAPAMAQHRGHDNGPQRAPAWHEQQASHGHKWRKGQRLAVNQRRYVVSDWQRRGLRTPPRGYQWVRENNNSGDFLLVAAATGIIASILSQ